MKPWIFWTGQAPAIVKYDQYANPVEEQPRRLEKVRIVVVEPHKYVIEQGVGTDALGGDAWMDAHDIGSVDPAMVLEACLLDIIARRNALGWIRRDEMPPEPVDDPAPSPAEIEAPKPKALPKPHKNGRRAERLALDATVPANTDLLESYEDRCRKKFTVEWVAFELKTPGARGRILRAFTEGVGQTLRTGEIAQSAKCSDVTVNNYCKDYAAAGWVERTDHGWKLLREVPDVTTDEEASEPAWQSRADLPIIKAEFPKPANGHVPVNPSMPLVDRVVDVLSQGPQKFDKLAGLLVVGTKPLSDALADLVSDGTVILKGVEYHLDQSV